jgi:DNA-binding HxlR family transcriptional regulator
MKSYGQFCPVAMAARILAERWTLLVIRELLLGSRHYNDIRRGVPLMSPTLLSKRLKGLQQAGVVTYRPARGQGAGEYHLTPAGKELRRMVQFAGEWGRRWASSRLDRNDLDAGFLMWDIRRFCRPEYFPGGRTVVNFEFTDAAPRKKYWWLVAKDGEVDLCLSDPGFDVDVLIIADLRTLTEIWTGDLELDRARQTGKINVSGSGQLVRKMDCWLGQCPMASIKRERNAKPAGGLFS